MNYNKNVKVTTAHLPQKNTKKFWIKSIIILLVVVSIIIFPEEIGSFIGKWVGEFVKGFRGLNG